MLSSSAKHPRLSVRFCRWTAGIALLASCDSGNIQVRNSSLSVASKTEKASAVVPVAEATPTSAPSSAPSSTPAALPELPSGEKGLSPPGCAPVKWEQYDPFVPDPSRYRMCAPVVVTESGTSISGCMFTPCAPGTSCTAITIKPGVSGVQIFDNYLYGLYGGRGIVAEGDNGGLYIYNNFFDRIYGRNIYVYKTGRFAIQANRFFNIHGTELDAGAISVNASVGSSIDVSGNRVLLFPNNVVGAKSYTSDVFNFYDSGGTDSAHRMKVNSNIIVGGSRGQVSGDGIAVGDGCLKGSFVEVKNNLLINAGLHGISGSGGRDYLFSANTIYNCGAPSREEQGAFTASTQQSFVTADCGVNVCDKMLWENNLAHARGIGTYGRAWNELLSFSVNNAWGVCSNVTQTGNEWQKTDLDPSFVPRDFMNWCSSDLNCPKSLVCRSWKCVSN